MRWCVPELATGNFALQSKVLAAEGLHVGIIMDGNGRWASRQGLARIAGHHAGVSSLREAVATACERGVATLTVYAFSADNWRRPASEVAGLMAILRRYFEFECASLVRNGIRVTVIGRRDRLAPDVVARIAHAEAVTASGRRLHLRIALDYSGRDAVVEAVRRIIAAGGAIARDAIDEAIAGDGGPEAIDLLIRSGGEQRLSDVLIWEAAYAELHFTETLWPDFAAEDFDRALAAYATRERRFGALPTGDGVGAGDPCVIPATGEL